VVTYILYFMFHYIIAYKIQGFELFETKKLLLISLEVCCVGACSLLAEEWWYVRWLVEIIVCVTAFLWADHNFNLVSMIKRKLHKS